MQSKSYIHVNDIFSALLTVVQNQTKSIDTYNVGNDDYITVRQIANIVIAEMGLTNTQVFFGDKAYGWKGDVPKVRFASKKINALNWKAKFNSEAAIRDSVRKMLGRD
jgi:UDP-glucose 4-epimerase